MDRIGKENSRKIDNLGLEMSQMKQREDDAMERLENELNEILELLKHLIVREWTSFT